MTENFYRTRKVNVDHSTFGGDITLFDFEGHQTLTSMADKIASDFRFNERCRKNIINRTSLKKKER